MAQTPTDPTKAQVWITKGIDELDFEFYFPNGPKGDPGGFTTGTSLAANNLNDIKIPGLYRQDDGTQSTLARNYPVVSSGLLEVQERVTGATPSVMQVFYPFLGTSGINPKSYYRRYLVSGTTWGPWEFYSAMRVDQAAGRAIYMYDPLNSREQMIYGDTGSRNIADLIDTTKVTVGTAKIRRFGANVELRLLGIVPLSGITGTVNLLNASLPSGFQNQHSLPFQAVKDGVTAIVGSLGFGGTPLSISNVTAGSNSSLTISYQTGNSWPTTLPGTADGTIGNI